MKIALPTNYKERYTISDVETAKRLIKSFAENKDDPKAIEDGAQRAAYAIFETIGDFGGPVLKVSAEAAKDARTPYDYFGEGFGRMNIWINFQAMGSDTFIDCGCLLSDVWSISGDADGYEGSYEWLKDRSFLRVYKLQK